MIYCSGVVATVVGFGQRIHVRQLGGCSFGRPAVRSLRLFPWRSDQTDPIATGATHATVVGAETPVEGAMKPRSPPTHQSTTLWLSPPTPVSIGRRTHRIEGWNELNKGWWAHPGSLSPRFTAETDSASSGSATPKTEDPETTLLERTSLLAEPRVWHLLVLYGLYMVGRSAQV